MFDYYILKEYAETGRCAGKALAAIDNASPLMAEENYYKLGELMNMSPAEAVKKLRADVEKAKKVEYTVDGNRFHSSTIEAMMGMSIEEYCGLK